MSQKKVLYRISKYSGHIQKALNRTIIPMKQATSCSENYAGQTHPLAGPAKLELLQGMSSSILRNDLLK